MFDRLIWWEVVTRADEDFPLGVSPYWPNEHGFEDCVQNAQKGIAIAKKLIAAYLAKRLKG